jgi:dimethylhistidine N-methyltransferase
MNDSFREDVVAGLSGYPKKLDSKYFYDAAGDKLFQQIMSCEEYYVTRCESEIFRNSSESIAAALRPGPGEFDLIELGAGDATKTVFLLRELSDQGVSFNYLPIDISGGIIEYLERTLPQKLKDLKVRGFTGEYLDMLSEAASSSDRKKAVLFLGSNIGNLEQIRSALRPGDRLLIGFDLKKDPETILAAYNDAKGYTKAFNLNLLERINRELGADFDTTQFYHYPTYDPSTGSCRSFLVSRRKQTVRVADREFLFEEGEVIDMEISRKYDLQEMNRLAEKSGFKVRDLFPDSKNWFADAVWECI